MRLLNVRMWLMPILISMIAYFFYIDDMKRKESQIQSRNKTYTCVDKTSQTRINITLPATWSAGGIEESEENVLGVFSSGTDALVLMRRDSGDWQTDKAIEKHIASVKDDEGFYLIEEPQKMELGNLECKYFVFQTLADGIIEGINVKIPSLNVVVTVIKNETIFRIQAVTTAETTSNLSDQKNRKKYQALLRIISDTRIVTEVKNNRHDQNVSVAIRL